MPAGVFSERSLRNSDGVNPKVDTFVLDFKVEIYLLGVFDPKLMMLRLSGNWR